MVYRYDRSDLLVLEGVWPCKEDCEAGLEQGLGGGVLVELGG